MPRVKPREEFRVLLVYPNLSLLLTPPLSMAIFTAILKQQGYLVDLFDVTPYVGDGTQISLDDDPKYQQETFTNLLQVRSFSYKDDLRVESKADLTGDFVRKVESFRPDLMLVSVVEDTFLQATELLGHVHHLRIPTLLGGVFVTAAPEVAISYDAVDMIGIGEGEQIIVDVAERVRLGEPCDSVPGVWVRKSASAVVRNPRGELVDFTRTIPDWSLFEDQRFYRPMGGRIFKSFALETYRGCPYSCAYCNSPMQVTLAREAGLGSFLRRSPMQRLRDHIAAIVETNKPEFFMIIDDSFLARPEKEIEAFCEMYDEFKIPFWFNTRPENVTENTLKALRSVNCYRMAFGIEHGNEEFRKDVLLRPVKNSLLLEKFALISDSGIAFSVNDVIGFPKETRELVFDTIELNRQIPGCDSLSISIFTPYHGTVLRKLAVELGYMDAKVICADMWRGSYLTMPQLGQQAIKGLLRTFPLYVLFDKSEWPEIERAEKFDDEGNAIFKRLAERYRAIVFSKTQDEKLQERLKVPSAAGCASNELDSIRI
jgi:radical SAM superfamily enzyme YgiQ (UPF0313 family)